MYMNTNIRIKKTATKVSTGLSNKAAKRQAAKNEKELIQKAIKQQTIR